MKIFKDLTAEEEEEFRQWAREHYLPKGARSNVWHPVVHNEMEKMERELGFWEPTEQQKKDAIEWFTAEIIAMRDRKEWMTWAMIEDYQKEAHPELSRPQVIEVFRQIIDVWVTTLEEVLEDLKGMYP